MLLIFAWKRPAVGFVAFLVVAVAFTILFVRDFYAVSNLLLFVLPPLLIASLFHADWRWLTPWYRIVRNTCQEPVIRHASRRRSVWMFE